MSCINLLAAGILAFSASGSTNIYLTDKEISEIQQGTACRNLVRQFFALQKRMNNKSIETDFYDLKILSTDELVAGRKGKYYSVHLKDAAKRTRFRFPGGRYVIPDFKTRFRRSLTAFVREILAKIEGGADYEIFVRGSGSNTRMTTKRTLRPGSEYNRIFYLPKIAPGKYEADNRNVHSVLKQYTNTDLPFLRAAFLQDTIGAFYPLKKPSVLQSEVADSADASAQFAELILFVDW